MGRVTSCLCVSVASCDLTGELTDLTVSRSVVQGCEEEGGEL